MESHQMEAVKEDANLEKRYWTREEDEVLINALLDLMNTGKYKADNGFKPRHHKELEDKLKVSLPHSNIKANPHILSRMRTLKTQFNIVHEMITGPNTSGFGYDGTTHCVVAEKEVWEPYLKDRATGKDAVTPVDVVEELDKEGIESDMHNEKVVILEDTDEVDVIMSGKSSDTNRSSEMNTRKKKRKTMDSTENMLFEVVEKSARLISSKMEASSEHLSRAIEDVSINELKSKINGELMKLQGLTLKERHRAIIKIGCDRDLTQLFFSVNDNEKEDWVKIVIS